MKTLPSPRRLCKNMDQNPNDQQSPPIQPVNPPVTTVPEPPATETVPVPDVPSSPPPPPVSTSLPVNTPIEHVEEMPKVHSGPNSGVVLAGLALAALLAGAATYFVFMYEGTKAKQPMSTEAPEPVEVYSQEQDMVSSDEASGEADVSESQNLDVIESEIDSTQVEEDWSSYTEIESDITGLE